MRHDKNEALTLRREGASYRAIMQQLGVPRATLSDWFSREDWSREIKNSLNKKNLIISTQRIIRLDKIRGERLKLVYKKAREDAIKDFRTLKYHPLFVAGVMAYWGEGDKLSKNGFRVTNSDPLLLKIYLEFLRKICGGDDGRIRAWVLVYPDLDKESCERYWSKKLGLNRKNFTKSITINGKHRTRKLGYGVCTISYSSRFLKEKMLIWMSLLAEDLLKR